MLGTLWVLWSWAPVAVLGSARRAPGRCSSARRFRSRCIRDSTCRCWWRVSCRTGWWRLPGGLVQFAVREEESSDGARGGPFVGLAVLVAMYYVVLPAFGMDGYVSRANLLYSPCFMSGMASASGLAWPATVSIGGPPSSACVSTRATWPASGSLRAPVSTSRSGAYRAPSTRLTLTRVRQPIKTSEARF